MKSLTTQLSAIVADAFEECGLGPEYGAVQVSNRPDLADFQCNGALAAAKEHGANPRHMAQWVADALARSEPFREVSIAGPGFINLTLTDDFLAAHAQRMVTEERLGCEGEPAPSRIIVDYGGANIAKPLHVGHLRSAIIGECLKRLAGFLGHHVVGDVHLGDWGLQMGMVISELERRAPDLPYFDAAYSGPYPADSPVAVSDLDEVYPTASARAAEDETAMDAARQATAELQMGRPGYRALWQHIYDVCTADLRADYAKLNVEFDLWLGESDTQERIPALLRSLRAGGWLRESEGALVIDVADPGDKHKLPPLTLVKSDGAVLYGTTDLATIQQRVDDFNADMILYVVDKRQSDHFGQVFRAARKSGIAPQHVALEHIGFGTMNGQDGTPFKTREGGVLRLKDLIQTITDKAMERMSEVQIARDYPDSEKEEIARRVGLATLKFADLMNHYSKDYVFDLNRFASFDGRTGPYLLYTAVRINSILRKAEERGLKPGVILAPASGDERGILLKTAELPDVLARSFATRSPNHLCEYAYILATLFVRFYHEHHILREEDAGRQASWLGVAGLSLAVLQLVLDLLGIELPERM